MNNVFTIKHSLEIPQLSPMESSIRQFVEKNHLQMQEIKALGEKEIGVYRRKFRGYSEMGLSIFEALNTLNSQIAISYARQKFLKRIQKILLDNFENQKNQLQIGELLEKIKEKTKIAEYGLEIKEVKLAEDMELSGNQIIVTLKIIISGKVFSTERQEEIPFFEIAKYDFVNKKFKNLLQKIYQDIESYAKSFLSSMGKKADEVGQEELNTLYSITKNNIF